MSLDRRAFLGRLLAGLGGLTLTPTDWLWRPGPRDALTLPPVVPGSLLTLQQITMELAYRINEEMSSILAPIAEGQYTQTPRLSPYRIGDHMMMPIGEPAIMLQHAFGVDMNPPREVRERGLDVARYVDPITDVLVRELKRRGVTALGGMSLPTGVEQAYQCQAGGAIVRGVMAFDMPSADYLLRFDVLGG